MRHGRDMIAHQIDPAAKERTNDLARLRHWYDETQNPLYAWEAIALCLHNDDPPAIPDWCVPYLRDVAGNIFALTRRADFRRRGATEKLSDSEALRLIPEALQLVSKGSRNAFASMVKDRDDMRDANTVMWNFKPDPEDPLEKIARRRSISPDRAKRIVARGNKLHKIKR